MSISKEQVNTATVNPDSRFRHPGVLLTGVGWGGCWLLPKSFRYVVHTMLMGWNADFYDTKGERNYLGHENY